MQALSQHIDQLESNIKQTKFDLVCNFSLGFFFGVLHCIISTASELISGCIAIYISKIMALLVVPFLFLMTFPLVYTHYSCSLSLP
jgi:uncharacterized protein YacL